MGIVPDKGGLFNLRAAEWVRSNPEAWRAMKMEARERAANARHFSIAELVEAVRYSPRHIERVDGFRFNNSYRAPLARMLVREVPECGPFIELRKSVCDK